VVALQNIFYRSSILQREGQSPPLVRGTVSRVVREKVFLAVAVRSTLGVASEHLVGGATKRN